MSEPRRPLSLKRRPHMRRFPVLAATLAVLLTGCTAAPPMPVQTSQAAVKYKAGLEDFSRTMLELGASAVLVETRINGEVWSHADGARSFDNPVPAQATDPTHIASITKSMLAASVLKLVEEGLVGLDDPVTRHLR